MEEESEHNYLVLPDDPFPQRKNYLFQNFECTPHEPLRSEENNVLPQPLRFSRSESTPVIPSTDYEASDVPYEHVLPIITNKISQFWTITPETVFIIQFTPFLQNYSFQSTFCSIKKDI